VAKRFVVCKLLAGHFHRQERIKIDVGLDADGVRFLLGCRGVRGERGPRGESKRGAEQQAARGYSFGPEGKRDVSNGHLHPPFRPTIAPSTGAANYTRRQLVQ
jgi:hypothetical protein